MRELSKTMRSESITVPRRGVAGDNVPPGSPSDLAARPLFRQALSRQMGMFRAKSLARASIIGLFVLCLSTSQTFAQPSLKEAFVEHFKIGTAFGTSQIHGEEPESLALIARHFNTITPENAMKWGSLHPRPGGYNFETADRYVTFGEQHDLFIVGHTLVWHNQTPDWVFEDARGEPVSREVLLERMEQHIHTVVGRYKGRIRAWDVVNEAINRSDRKAGTGERRPSPWQTIIGDDYIEQAFRFAHAADPAAELYYNDYNLAKPKKRAAAIELVKSLLAKGVRIDGIGAQCHVELDWPSVVQFEAMLDELIDELRPLGMKVMVTELDVASPKNDQRLANRYAALFRAFVERSTNIDRVTFWGVHDGQSWLKGKKPLLFDDQLQPKQPVFSAVIETKKKSNRSQ